MGTVAFAALTPFYFLKAGLLVSLLAVAAGFGLIVAFLGLKVDGDFVTVALHKQMSKQDMFHAVCRALPEGYSAMIELPVFNQDAVTITVLKTRLP